MENDGNVYGWRMLDMQKVVAHPKARALWGTSSWIVKSLKKNVENKNRISNNLVFLLLLSIRHEARLWNVLFLKNRALIVMYTKDFHSHWQSFANKHMPAENRVLSFDKIPDTHFLISVSPFLPEQVIRHLGHP
jgi:hypothetical protein